MRHHHSKHQYQSFRRCMSCGILGLILVLGLGFPEGAAAKGYRPKRKKRPQSTVVTAGTRGCAAERSGADFAALAPLFHVGESTSPHPTFAWYMPHQASYLLTFQLAEADAEYQSIIYEQNLNSQTGLMQLTLPTSTALSSGKNYSWRVILRCQRDHPSADQVIGGEIAILDRTEPVTDAEFWYDAFASANPNQKRLLLQDLSIIEQNDGGKLGERHRQSIQNIIDRL